MLDIVNSELTPNHYRASTYATPERNTRCAFDASETNYLDNMVGGNPARSDTFFREFGSSAFFIEGVGSVMAHHINYIGVGMMAAHFGNFSASMLDG